ncbi:MAG: hypothetical protein IJD91_00905 [Clostridia bacterium]|nr:hypothetical protein [Clostridia bacterium]
MSNKKDSLGDRMKSYEGISRIYLTKRMPVIIRIDGKAFHSFTKGFRRPFDEILIKAMQETAKYLCKNIMGCKIAYTQSDEISLLLEDYERVETQPWFENNLQKIVSVSASMATMAFNRAFADAVNERYSYYTGINADEWTGSTEEFDKLFDNYFAKIGTAMFDSRVFILPKEEVCNYFIWRQQDATRNSIQMVAQSLFSHRQLQNKNCDQLQEMMFQEHNINWNDYPTVYKRGSCVTKEQYTENDVTRSRWVVDTNIPIFTQDRNYIDRLVFLNEILCCI